ncbi:MAG: polyamine aminopropyltransferase [Alphaproteobacteria bacterium]
MTPSPRWYDETLYDDVRQGFVADRVLYEGETGFQKIRIIENSRLGRVLFLDDIVQTTEADEHIYHEMMVHVPLFAHGRARRVLIIGGGDGGILEEVLKHDVEKAVMVELDGGVVDICRTYLPGISNNAFDDPRTELIIGDGARYVAESAGEFDVIISDSTDPIGPAEVLFGETFYGNCRKRLSPGGIMVAQNGVPFFQGDEVTTSYRRLHPLFADVTFYLAPVPTYYGGAMTLAWAALDAGARNWDQAELAARIDAQGLDLRYYNADIHRACFALPEGIRRLMRLTD